MRMWDRVELVLKYSRFPSFRPIEMDNNHDFSSFLFHNFFRNRTVYHKIIIINIFFITIFPDWQQQQCQELVWQPLISRLWYPNSAFVYLVWKYKTCIFYFSRRWYNFDWDSMTYPTIDMMLPPKHTLFVLETQKRKWICWLRVAFGMWWVWDCDLLAHKCMHSIYLTEYARDKLNQPTNFVLKVRKHIRNKRIDSIRQIGYVCTKNQATEHFRIVLWILLSEWTKAQFIWS